MLPTGGQPLLSPQGYDFIKRTGVVYYTPEALASVTGDVIKFAEAEGLAAHANSVRIRDRYRNRDGGRDRDRDSDRDREGFS